MAARRSLAACSQALFLLALAPLAGGPSEPSPGRETDGAAAAKDPASPGAPLPPPGELGRIKALIDAGGIEAARARLEQLVEAHPQWARATFLLGLTYYKENRFEAAKPHFARALAADPQETAILPPYGWALYSLGELDAAREIFATLLERLPDYTAAHYALGVIHFDRDEVELAEGRFETTARLAAEQADPPMEARARARLGELAVRQGDLATARSELERAVELAPGDEAARFALSRVRERLARGGAAEPAPGVAAQAPEAARTGLRFSPVPGSAGIDLVMTSGGMPSREILEVDGGGIALLDYDGDGDLDVFLANGATLEAPDHGPGSRLYANDGEGRFTDVTDRAGIELERWAMGVAVGDADGDGWDDLYVTCWGPDALLRNVASERGGRRFVDVAAEAGVADDGWSTSAAFADLDGDEDLDLYVANYLEFDPTRPPSRAGRLFQGVPVMAGPLGLVAQPDALYQNLGDGRFRDATAVAGVQVTTGLDYGLGVRVLDYDGDGRQDLFVGNDSTPDLLFRNLGGLRFEEVGVVAGVATNGIGTPQATMGIAVADVDSNAYPDLFLSVFADDTNTLHANLGNGLFEDRSARFGLGAASRPYLGWGCGFYDFDLDGDEDLFVANGHVYPQTDDPAVAGGWAQRPLLFERRGDRFEPACAGAGEAGSPAARPWCEERRHGRATAFGDLDGDRDVDVLMTTLNGPVEALRNDALPRPSLVVRLAGPPPNRHAYGSVVELETPAGVQRRWVTGGGSFQSVDSPDATFGLGEPAPARLALRVRWPGGATTELEDVPAGKLLVVRHPAGPPGRPAGTSG